MKQKRVIALLLIFMLIINFIPLSNVYAVGEDSLKVGVYTQDGVIYQSVNVEFIPGDTAYSVLSRLVGDLEVRGSGASTYVSSIAGLAEFDQGPLSGWVYAVNGVKPDVSAGIFSLNPGDKLVWHYTVDLGEDIYKGINKLENYIASNPPVPPEVEKPIPPVSNEPPKVEKPVPSIEGNQVTKPSPENPSSGGGTLSSNDNNLSDDTNNVENDKETHKVDKTSDEGKTENKDKIDVNNLSSDELNKSVDVILESAKKLFQNNINSTWEAIALKKLGGDVSEEYLNSIISEIKKNNGIFNKVTDLEKNILLLNMVGYDVTNIEGVNLLEILLTSNLEKQGSNGVIFALISLNSIDNQVVDKFYKENSIKEDINTEEDILEILLSYQLDNGSFSLAKGKEENVDITAMALQALGGLRDKIDKETSYYQKLDEAILRATNYLKKVKFENSESIAQTIIACSYIGEDPKNFGDLNLIEELLKYKKDDNTFKHVMESDIGDSGMSTEQGVLALLSYKGQESNKKPIYYGKVQNNVKVASEKDDDNNVIMLSIVATIIVLGVVGGFILYKKSRKKS